jgi:ATPase subunit of ABC transporter with duplicated ATPase domains
MFPAGRDEQMIRSKLGGANIPAEDLIKKMSQLSYGQRVKIRFLQLMLSSYDLLILDEPTNHLDISTREALEMMLQQYE